MTQDSLQVGRAVPYLRIHMVALYHISPMIIAGIMKINFVDIWIRHDQVQWWEGIYELYQTQLAAHELGHAMSLWEDFHNNPFQCYKDMPGNPLGIMDAITCTTLTGPTGLDITDFQGNYVAKQVASASLEQPNASHPYTVLIRWNGDNVYNEKVFDILRAVNGGPMQPVYYSPKNTAENHQWATPPGNTYCYWVRPSNALYPFSTSAVFAGCS